MKKTLVCLFLALSAATPAAASRQLDATQIKGVSLRKNAKIVIINDARSIRGSRIANGKSTRQVQLRSPRVTAKPARTTVSQAVRNATFRTDAKLDSRVPVYLRPIIQEAAQRHGLDPRLLAAVARQESRFRPDAVSPVGARGVMQLMPTTAAWLGVKDSFDARQNIFGGAKYLSMLFKQFNGNVDLTLAAYNAGPGAVKKHRGIPPYRETRDYVTRIRRDYNASL